MVKRDEGYAALPTIQRLSHPSINALYKWQAFFLWGETTMYDLTESEKAIYTEMENRKKAVESLRRSRHKCNTCPYADWINNKKVLCTYSPVSCVKDEVK